MQRKHNEKQRIYARRNIEVFATNQKKEYVFKDFEQEKN
jgi:hypothetical protein